MPRFARFALVLLATLGCSGSESPGGGVKVTDSAGVVVVTHRANLRDTSLIAIDKEPQVRIGGDSPDPRYVLEDFRGAVRLSDGRIVVALRRTQELRYYDSL